MGKSGCFLLLLKISLFSTANQSQTQLVTTQTNDTNASWTAISGADPGIFDLGGGGGPNFGSERTV